MSKSEGRSFMVCFVVIAKTIAMGTAALFVNIFTCVLPSVSGSPGSALCFWPGSAGAVAVATPITAGSPTPEPTPEYTGQMVIEPKNQAGEGN